MTAPARTAANARHSAASSRRTQRLSLWIVLGTTLGGLGVYWYSQRYTPPDPPKLDLSDVDDEVAAAIKARRLRVLDSPDVADHWGDLGAVLQAHDFPVEARNCWTVAERLAPRDPRWPYLIAGGLVDTDLSTAIDNMRRSVALGRQNPVPRLRLGELLLLRGNSAEAQSVFQALLEESANRQSLSDRVLFNARAHLGLGQAALARNAPQAALVHLLEAVEGAPLNKNARLLLARTYLQLGDRQTAAREAERAERLAEGYSWPDPWGERVSRSQVGLQARARQIHQLEKAGRGEQALHEARQALLKHPQSTLAHLTLGRLLNRARRWAEAETILREGCQLDPKSSLMQIQYGSALQSQGRIRDARACYEKAKDLEPECAEARYGIALCLLELHDRDGAMNEFQAAVRIRPNYTDSRMQLAKLLVELGRCPDAQAEMEQACQLAPKDERALKFREQVRARCEQAADK